MTVANPNSIIASSNPKGVREPIIVSGTPKPGTVMQVKAATEPVAGRFTYEAYDVGIDGERGLVAVLLERTTGNLTDAYASGDSAEVYFPANGEFMNMLLLDVSGTADSHAIGDRLMVDDGTGKLVDTAALGGSGTPEAEPFICMETKAALTADTLVLCKYSAT